MALHILFRVRFVGKMMCEPLSKGIIKEHVMYNSPPMRVGVCGCPFPNNLAGSFGCAEDFSTEALDITGNVGSQVQVHDSIGGQK
jgi:hypothetical protein